MSSVIPTPLPKKPLSKGQQETELQPDFFLPVSILSLLSNTCNLVGEVGSFAMLAMIKNHRPSTWTWKCRSPSSRDCKFFFKGSPRLTPTRRGCVPSPWRGLASDCLFLLLLCMSAVPHFLSTSHIRIRSTKYTHFTSGPCKDLSSKNAFSSAES